MQRLVLKRFWLFVAFCLCLQGCETIGYYGQAAKGQLQLMMARDKNQKVVERDPESHLAKQLLLIEQMREFAKEELSLPVGGAYSTYVDLKREAVVWNVFAAPKLSLQPKTWCFPIAGCVSYRGYFSKAAAQKKADELAEQGFDTYVGTAAAYSTLGWFDDSVLSTFINRSESRLAALLFHELAHRRFYVAGDTKFNESYARTIEIASVQRWFKAQERDEAFVLFEKGEAQYQEIVQFLLAQREALKKVYESDLSDEQKLAKKQQILAEIPKRFAEMDSDGELKRYKNWLSRPFNNARLLTIASYNDWVPAFTQLLKRVDGDFPRFFKRVEDLADLPKDKRDKELERLSLQKAVQGAVEQSGNP